MPIELSESLKNTCGSQFVSRGMNRLFCSKFYTTLILTIIILILIMIIYPCQKGTPYWVLGKLGLYIFVGSLVILFIHDGVLYSTIKKEIKGGESDAFISSIGGDNVVFGGEAMPVKPNVIGVENTNNICGGESDQLFAMYGV